MEYSVYQILLVFCIFLKHSYTLECSNKTVNFDATTTSFKIQSDPTDLSSKYCKYTFTLPQYFVPSIGFLNIQLTGSNKIFARQYTDYGGSKVVEFNGSNTTMTSKLSTFAPVNFTIEISLPAKTATDTFSILIQVSDKTPVITGDTFIVKKDLGTLIESSAIQGNFSILQVFDTQSPQATLYTIRVAIFTDPNALMDLIFVYDDGVCKGSLLDVFNAQNSTINKICYGTQFAIVNTNQGIAGIYTVLISEAHEWDEKSVSITNAPLGNTTQILTATNGLVVLHEIRNPIAGTIIPNFYQQISFRGDGELKVFAGCVTGTQESRRIATITPSTAHNYENLLIYGKCKTFVLTKGVLQWQSTQMFPTDTFRHEIGRKGVIMSSDYPYPNSDTTTRNYLIQSPSSSSNENIIVNYETASMASDVFFFIDQYIKAYTDANKTITPTDTTYTSISTYQQYILYNAPNNSDGFLVRYTVTSSSRISSFIGAFFVVFSVCFY
uniref:CUB_2 domain-containing protein n=1 Tax=Caenorhabditis tropicalis TaxID=1561998 RepID=A0A1I7T093_9PELO